MQVGGAIGGGGISQGRAVDGGGDGLDDGGGGVCAIGDGGGVGDGGRGGVGGDDGGLDGDLVGVSVRGGDGGDGLDHSGGGIGDGGSIGHGGGVCGGGVGHGGGQVSSAGNGQEGGERHLQKNLFNYLVSLIGMDFLGKDLSKFCYQKVKEIFCF